MDLRYRPWTLDFTPDDLGTRAFPFDQVVHPYRANGMLTWKTGDWDPALRFWALPFDPNLTEWLKTVDVTAPSIMAAREFASAPGGAWRNRANTNAGEWLEAGDLEWQLQSQSLAERKRANGIIVGEIEQLKMLMQDDRERYLAEAEAQADGLADYVIHFIGADRARHPWTVELISCGLAMGNIAYMYWKGQFRRVRPSFLCPGLVPPFGPPGHPAFPSGHSLLGHLIALLLLEIPAIRQRFGVFAEGSRRGREVKQNTLDGAGEIKSPLLWLAQRLGKNRERIGVHYPSDTLGSRHLASGMWWALLHAPPATRIDCPTLHDVLAHARAEWPTPWP